MLVFLIAGFNSCLMGHKLMLLEIQAKWEGGKELEWRCWYQQNRSEPSCPSSATECRWKRCSTAVPLALLPSSQAPPLGRESRFWNVMPHCRFNPEQPWGCYSLVLQLSWARSCWRIDIVGKHLSLAWGKCPVQARNPGGLLLFFPFCWQKHVK